MKWASSETVARWPSRANRAATNPNSAEPKPSPPTTPSAPPSPRTLLTHKLEGQLHVTANLPNLDEALTAHAAITAALADLEQAGTIELMRQAESQAARAYWQAWASTPLTFARRDVGQVPDSWRVFGSRTSTLSGGPRLAATPGNALLNYLYALAEQEAILALRAVGLDPGLAIVHKDQTARASLATWAEHLAPLAEHTAETLLNGRPTPLTETRRITGRDAQRRQRVMRTETRRLKPPVSCGTCGGMLRILVALTATPAFPKHERNNAPASPAPAQTELARLRQAGRDPAHGGDAARRRSGTMKQRQRDANDWERRQTGPIDLTAFKRGVLPRIRNVPGSSGGLTRTRRSPGRRRMVCPR